MHEPILLFPLPGGASTKSFIIFYNIFTLIITEENPLEFFRQKINLAVEDVVSSQLKVCQ